MLRLPSSLVQIPSEARSATPKLAETCDWSGQSGATRHVIAQNPRNDAEMWAVVDTFEAVARPGASAPNPQRCDGISSLEE